MCSFDSYDVFRNPSSISKQIFHLGINKFYFVEIFCLLFSTRLSSKSRKWFTKKNSSPPKSTGIFLANLLFFHFIEVQITFIRCTNDGIIFIIFSFANNKLLLKKMKKLRFIQAALTQFKRICSFLIFIPPLCLERAHFGFHRLSIIHFY